MNALTKEALQLAVAASLPREKVDLPELGGYVYVRGMTGAERDDYEKSNFIIKGGNVKGIAGNQRARLAVRCIVGEDGKRLLADTDAAWLGNLRADSLTHIFAVAQRLSAVTEEDLAELKNASASAGGSDLPTS